MNKETGIVIHYIATKAKVISILQTFYSQEGIIFEPYSPKTKMENIQYLLLLEPLQIKSEEYAISRLWKPWLMDKAPHVHLIIATFNKSRHPNLIDLSDLSKDLKEEITQTLPILKFVPEHAGTIIKNGLKQNHFNDPWERSLPLTGQNLKDIMIRFIRGHDRSNSYFEQLTRLRAQMDDLAYWIEKQEAGRQEKIDHLYDSIEDEWGLLQNRWNQYKEFMPFLPFAQAAKIIKKDMIVLKNLIEDNEWENQKSKPQMVSIERIRLSLERDFLPYIYAEEYW